MQHFSSFLFGLASLVALTRVEVTHGLEHDDDFPCNVVLGYVSKDEIQLVVETAVGFALAPVVNVTDDDRVSALQGFLPLLQYDLVVSRVCGSCVEFLEEGVMDPTAAAPYCGPDVYASNATYSALVMHPLMNDDDMDGTPIPLPGIRPVHFTLQATRLSALGEAPSEHWPTNVTERLEQNVAESSVSGSLFNFSTSFSDTMPLMLAASAGMVAISPDPLGTGANRDDYDRSYLTALPQQQAALVSYYAAQRYTDAVTTGCTALADDITVHGYSAGGFNSIVLAPALVAQGLNVVRVFSQAGTYNIAVTAQSVMGEFLYLYFVL